MDIERISWFMHLLLFKLSDFLHTHLKKSPKSRMPLKKTNK